MLTRCPLPAFFDNDKIANLVLLTIRDIHKEALAVGQTMGFDKKALPDSSVEDMIKGTWNSVHKPDMLRDLGKGGPLEIEILGEVVRAGRECRLKNLVRCVRMPTVNKSYAL